MLITKEIEIDMSHRVPNHFSKCRTPHGHRYKIEVGVDDKIIRTKGTSSEGMVLDFSILKEIMMNLIDKPYDHSGCFFNEDPKKEYIIKFYEGCPKKPIFVPFIPTAENLAEHWFKTLKPALSNQNIKIKHVKVWETPSSTAVYEE